MISGVVRWDLSVYDFQNTSIRICVDIEPICDTCVDLDAEQPKAVFADKISSQSSRSVVTVETGIEWHQVVGIVEGKLGAALSRQITRLGAELHIP